MKPQMKHNKTNLIYIYIYKIKKQQIKPTKNNTNENKTHNFLKLKRIRINSYKKSLKTNINTYNKQL